jgi:hypothetical protein
MNRPRSLSLCACLALSVAAMACSSSSNQRGTGGAGAGGGATGGAGGSAAGGAGGAGGGGASKLWDEARIANTFMAWWLNIRKGAYYVSLEIGTPDQDDMVARKAVIDFGKVVAAKLTSASAATAALAPADGEVSGWKFDPIAGKTDSGPAVGNDKATDENLVDGAADPFFDPSKSYQAKSLVWQNYINDPYTLVLQVWQMPSVEQAVLVYADLPANSVSSVYKQATFTPCSGTDPANPCGSP